MKIILQVLQFYDLLWRIGKYKLIHNYLLKNCDRSNFSITLCVEVENLINKIQYKINIMLVFFTISLTLGHRLSPLD